MGHKPFHPQKPEMSNTEILSWILLFPLKLTQFLINRAFGEWVGRLMIRCPTLY